VPGDHIYHTAARSLLCFFPVCILSIYTCLYLLSPLLAKHKQYTWFVLGFLGMAIVFLCINYFGAQLFLRLAYYYGKPETASFNLAFINTTHALIIGGISLGIQFSKNWYLRQKENILLARQKVVTELQLEKARIYPRFLHQSLDSLRKDLSKGSANASSLLLKISDLLSYILYDNNEKWVALEKELIMMQHLIDIEQSGRIKHLDLRISISGFTTGKYIVPMTLFQLLEHVFGALDEHRSSLSRLELDIQIRIQELCVTLAIVQQKNNGSGPDWSKVFYRTGQRLDAIYPGGCQLKLKKEGSTCTLLLQVALQYSGDVSSSISLSETTTALYETS
ncbi:MAG: histidine kinase, partial [Chitinophagaceae bacterium]